MQFKSEGISSGQTDEASLVAEIQAGNFTALEKLYERYSRQAYGLALKILNNHESAEDIIQEAFLKLWKQPDSFDPHKGRFISWLLTVVHNLCVSQLRRTRVKLVSLELSTTTGETSVGQLTTLENIASNNSVEEAVWLGMQRDLVRKALGELPVEQRQVIQLVYYGGLTQQEIATKTSLPLGTVKSRVRLGLLKLGNLLNTTNENTVALPGVNSGLETMLIPV